MSKGIAKRDRVGSAGSVNVSDAGNWDYIYESSTVQSEKWNPGDCVVLPDGREFHYAKSSGICASGQSVDFDQTGVQAYANASVAAAVGDRAVTVGAGTHDAIAKDALRGGYFVSWPAADKDQFRGIIGNDASAANAAIKVYLDGPLTVAITTSTGCELYENPYASVIEASNAALGKGGVPAVYVGAADTYFWVQTKGPVFVAPQTTADGHGGVGCMFRHDGSLDGMETALGATVPATDGTQYAGFRIIGSASGNGPLFMLT